MSDKETKIMKTFEEIIPKLSDADKTYLLGYGEGLAAAVNMGKHPAVK